MTPDQVEFKGAAGICSVRLTPWDERALGIRTAEICTLQVNDCNAVPDLLREMENWCRLQEVSYLFGRVDGSRIDAKGALLREGYAIVECSLTLSKRGFSNLPHLPLRMRPVLRSSTVEDLPDLKRIARDDFVHGRFLEDPSIIQGNARERTANWIADLVAQRLAYTAISDGTVIGFHAERLSDDGRHADLILTGVATRYAMLGLPLWVVALESLAERGVQSCSTLVSAANTGVVNLYAKLGFRFDSTFFGYRKYL